MLEGKKQTITQSDADKANFLEATFGGMHANIGRMLDG